MLRDYIIVVCVLICTIHANSLLPKCPVEGTATFPDPENQQRYFFCKDSVLVSSPCDNNSVFDVKKSKCVKLEQVSSEDEIISVLPKKDESNVLANMKMQELAVPNDSTFKCPDQEEQNYPCLQDCRKYYHCNKGEHTLETCRMLTLFDAKTKQCQLLVQASCFEVTTAAPTTTTLAPPICPADKTVDIPYPQNCNKYYHCENGVSELRKCWWFQRFDTKTMTCRFFFFSTCYSK